MIKALDLVQLSSLNALLERGYGALFAKPVSTREHSCVRVLRLSWFRDRVSEADWAVVVLFDFLDDLLLLLFD